MSPACPATSLAGGWAESAAVSSSVPRCEPGITRVAPFSGPNGSRKTSADTVWTRFESGPSRWRSCAPPPGRGSRPSTWARKYGRRRIYAVAASSRGKRQTCWTTGSRSTRAWRQSCPRGTGHLSAANSPVSKAERSGSIQPAGTRPPSRRKPSPSRRRAASVSSPPTFVRRDRSRMAHHTGEFGLRQGPGHGSYLGDRGAAVTSPRSLTPPSEPGSSDRGCLHQPDDLADLQPEAHLARGGARREAPGCECLSECRAGQASIVRQTASGGFEIVEIERDAGLRLGRCMRADDSPGIALLQQAADHFLEADPASIGQDVEELVIDFAAEQDQHRSARAQRRQDPAQKAALQAEQIAVQHDRRGVPPDRRVMGD